METINPATLKNVMAWTNTQVRNGAFPLERYSVFTSFDDAKTYATENPVSYEGQIVAVNANGQQKVYVIDSSVSDGSGLRELASGASLGGEISAVLSTLNSEISARTEADKYLSAQISTLTETTLPLSVSNLQKDLTVSLSSEAGADDSGVLKTYTLKQGGVEIGTIDIPRDFLVKNAEIKTCTEANKPKAGLKVGDKYIDFTVNTKDSNNAANETHLYIAFTDLAQLYTPVNSDTIDLTITDDNKISADVVDGSIGTVKLTDGAVTEDKIADAAVTNDKIASGAVDTEQLADKAVTNDKIALSAITLDRLSSDITEYIESQAGGALDEAKDYIDQQISALDFTQLDVSADQTVKIIRQDDGKLSATAQAIQISKAQVTGLEDDLTALIGNEDSVSSDSSVEGAKRYADEKVKELGDQVADLDAVYTNDSAGKTVHVARQDDGKLSVTYRAIEIDHTQISDWNTEIAGLSTALTSIISAVSSQVETDFASADETLSSALTSLISAVSSEMSDGYEDADEALSTSLTSLISAVSAQVETDFEDADEALSSSLTSLISAISSEMSEGYEDADEALSTSLTSLISAVSSQVETDFTEADQTLSTNLTSLISAVSSQVETDFANADTALSTALTSYVISNYVPLSVAHVTGDGAATSTNKLVTSADVSAAIANVAGVLHLIGVLDRVEDKTDEEVISDWAEGKTLKAGDVVVVGAAEYVYTDEKSWVLFGDETIYATKTELQNEHNDRLSAEGQLSTAIDNKVYVDGLSVDTLNVKHIDQDDYHALVKGGNIDENTIYVVSADNLNMFGEKIVNLQTDPTDLSSAANVEYVNQQTKAVQDMAISAITLNGAAFTVANNTASLSITIIDCGTALD